ncbi:MAG: hypothetical protein P8X55_04820 [Desulfosarcinaceae bacterium]
MPINGRQFARNRCWAEAKWVSNYRKVIVKETAVKIVMFTNT